MFGFGRPAQEVAVINLFAQQFVGLGFSTSDAKNQATNLVNETKKEILARQPNIILFHTTQGTIFSQNPSFMKPRLDAGLRVQDVLDFWNRPYFVVMCEMKMRTMLDYMVLHVAHEQGQDLDLFAINQRRNSLKYGDPAQWSNSAKVNRGFSEKDADIFLEFTMRVDAWRAKTSDNEVERLLKEHSSFNALVRSLISKGVI